MKAMDINDTMGKAWHVFRVNIGFLLLVGVIAVVGSLLSCLILAGPLSVGMLLIVRRLIQGDPVTPRAGDIFKGLDDFLPSFLLMLLAVCASFAASLILRVVPVMGQWVGVALSVVLSSWAMWALMFIAFDQVTATDAVKKVYQGLRSGGFIQPFLFGMLAGLITVFGAALCGVGALFSFPFACCMLVCAYLSLYSDGEKVIGPEVIPPPDDLRL